MTLRSVFLAAIGAAVLLLVMAAAGLGLLRASVGAADHGAIHAALVAATPADLGLPRLRVRQDGFTVNRYSECVGLSILLREDDWLVAEYDPILPAIRADSILPAGDGTMCMLLDRALADEGAVNWFTYARYWHGSLMLHRAVLSGGDYGVLKLTAKLALAAAALALLAALAWRIGLVAALALLIPPILLTDIRAIGELPLQAMCMVALLAAAAVFVAFGARWRGAGALLAVALAGGLLNFFDFLYNPSSFAMVCAWSWLAVGLARGETRPAIGALLVFAAALGGYGGMWALKWIAAFAADPSGTEIFVFGVGEFTRWGPVETPLAASALIWAATFDAGWKIAIGAVLAGLCGAAVIWRGAGRRDGFWRAALSLMLPILPAWAVVELMSGHTMAHPEFTFRIAAWTIGVVLASLAVAARYTAPASRNAAISSAE